MTTITVEDLNRRLADDTDGAFPDLVRLLQDGVYSGALQFTRDPHDAQDVTQETFVRAYRALHRYDSAQIRHLELRAWVWTIALNLCRNLARSRSRRPEVTGVDLDRSVANEDPAAIATESADSAMWRRRLLRLKEPQRNAVVLHHVVGLPHQEIAEITGRGESTTRSDLRRGLAALRGIIEEESS
jgi:RNA polymerase sigma-70 factor (ECF subfamily)